MSILNKLNRKFGRFYIENLMLYIVIGTGIVFAFWFLFPDIPLMQYLTFDRDAIFRGQVWRVITFIFVPQSGSPISMVFWLYMYWFIGSSLESAWGSFNFNVYYFLGVLLTAVGGFITGYATNYYINLSLFLAMAIIFPNTQLLLFFFIPVKMKWLAWLDAAMLIYEFIPVSLLVYAISVKMPLSLFWNMMGAFNGQRLAIFMSMLNLVLFFGGDFFRKIRDKFKYRKVRSNFKKNIKMTKYEEK